MLRAIPLLSLLLAGCASVGEPVTATAESAVATDRPRNVILLIADGFGPASATLGRELKGAPLSFEPHVRGLVATASTDSRVTDSAAAATAYACGARSYNGAIAVLPDGSPCRTVLETAEARGLATGLVATSKITHATPAAFAAHVPQRSQEDEIAVQMAASGVDVLLGGGRALFVDRDDGRDLASELAAAGYAVALDRDGFDALDAAPAVALLAPRPLAHEVDRDPAEQPSLAEMTATALDLLAGSRDGGENGFFLMVEGSRIDHAAHRNDAVGHAHDILAFDAASEVALDFARRDGNTLVVVTADHETGGVTLGRVRPYVWDPAPLRAAATSTERLAARLAAPDADSSAVLSEALAPLGLSEADRRRAELAADPVAAYREAVDALTHIGWTTGGHTGVDVPLYAFGPGADLFSGALSNDEVGRRLFRALGVDEPRSP